jgi:hypothetical protein
MSIVSRNQSTSVVHYTPSNSLVKRAGVAVQHQFEKVRRVGQKAVYLVKDGAQKTYYFVLKNRKVIIITTGAVLSSTCLIILGLLCAKKVKEKIQSKQAAPLQASTETVVCATSEQVKVKNRELERKISLSLSHFFEIGRPMALGALPQADAAVYNTNRNLAILTTIIDTLSADKKNAEALHNVRFVQYVKCKNTKKWELKNTSLSKLLEPFLSGEKEIGKKEELRITAAFKAQIRAAIEAQNKLNLARSAVRRERPTDLSIKNFAELFGIERQAKVYFRGKNWLGDQGFSYNRVVPVNADSKTIGYFKIGSTSGSAPGIMEEFMSNTATLFGLEDLFAATKQTSVQTKSDKTPQRGGLQAALDGTRLDSYLLDPKNPIHMDEVIKGTMATLLFGMFDAHYQNVFVGQDGKIKFFDNTRSLPNTNCALDWCTTLLIPYRSGLMQLDQSYQALTKDQLKVLESQIETFLGKMDKFKKYVNSTVTKKMLKKLPKGWFEENKIIWAMKERLTNMKAAIKDNRVKNLRDLTFASSPTYKFAAVLQMINSSRDFSEALAAQKYNLNFVFPATFELLINNARNLRYNVHEIQKMCMDPKSAFEDILRECFKPVTKLKALDYFEASNSAARALQELKRTAVVENKDLSEKEIIEVERFRQRGFLI